MVETFIGNVEEKSLTHTSIISYYLNAIQPKHIFRKFMYVQLSIIFVFTFNNRY